MTKKRNKKKPVPVHRPSVVELRLAGAKLRRRSQSGGVDALTLMELGTLLDTSDAHTAVDVIWQTYTVGYPAGGTGDGPASGEPPSSTERAALKKRTDPSAINLRILVDLVEEQPIDGNQARALVIGLRSAIHHPNRVGTACEDCGFIVDAHRKKCWRKDCPGNQPDRTCGRCEKQIGDDEKMVMGMHRTCYDAKTYETKTTKAAERGTDSIDVTDTTGMTSTEEAA